VGDARSRYDEQSWHDERSRYDERSPRFSVSRDRGTQPVQVSVYEGNKVGVRVAAGGTAQVHLEKDAILHIHTLDDHLIMQPGKRTKSLLETFNAELPRSRSRSPSRFAMPILMIIVI